MIDTDDGLRQLLHAIADTPVDTPPPCLQGAKARPHRSTARRARPVRRLSWPISLLAAVAVPAVGVGIAAASGVLPEQFLHAMSFQRQVGVDPHTAVLAGSLPGPSGQRFEVWRTTGKNGATCLTDWFVPDTTSIGTAPATFTGGSAACRSTPASSASFDDADGVDGGPDGNYVYSYDAGNAATATLRQTTGTTPALVIDGQIFGWFHSTATGPPVLTAYAASGTVIGIATIVAPPR